LRRDNPTPGWVNFQSATLGQFSTGGNRGLPASQLADLKQLNAAEQKEIELMKEQIRILAQPHPAKIDLPIALPGNP